MAEKKLETAFSYFAQGHISHGWLVKFQQNSNFMPALFTCKYEEA